MAIIAPVEDGKVLETESQSSLSGKESTNSSTLDKDAFLQLLVAQMKYQDPLEPTSNTEYVSQFATFSELEQMQNMSASMDLTRASSLVGETVYIKTTGTSGEATYVQGKVDYVYYENGKAFLSINEELYSLDDLDTVVDKTYHDAYNAALELAYSINRLPAVKNLSIGERKKVEEIYNTYHAMDEYEKTFVATDYEKLIEQYYAKMQELIEEYEGSQNKNETSDSESEE